MGWLRLVDSFKLQVSFAEYSLFYGALLQRRPVILRSLLIVATPYPQIVINSRIKDLQVSFAEYRLFYGALLQRRLVILRTLLIIATPYPRIVINSRIKDLQVSFAEYRLFYRALLQRRLVILRTLLIIAAPYLRIVFNSRIKGLLTKVLAKAETISRLLNLCLFCRIQSLLQGSFAKETCNCNEPNQETYNCKQPTHRILELEDKRPFDFVKSDSRKGGKGL